MLCVASVFLASGLMTKAIVGSFISVQPLYVNLAPLSWLAQIDLGIEVPKAVTPTAEVPKQVLKQQILAKRALKRTAHTHIKLNKRIASKFFPKKQVLGKVRRVDEIHLSVAAPAIASPKEAVNLQVDENTSKFGPEGLPEGLSELRKLELMHRFITLRFMIALNSTAVLATSQVAMGDEQKPADVNYAIHETIAADQVGSLETLAAQLEKKLEWSKATAPNLAASAATTVAAESIQTSESVGKRENPKSLAAVERQVTLSNFQQNKENISRIKKSPETTDYPNIEALNQQAQVLAMSSQAENTAPAAGNASELAATHMALSQLAFDSSQSHLNQVAGIPSVVAAPSEVAMSESSAPAMTPAGTTVGTAASTGVALGVSPQLATQNLITQSLSGPVVNTQPFKLQALTYSQAGPQSANRGAIPSAPLLGPIVASNEYSPNTEYSPNIDETNHAVKELVRPAPNSNINNVTANPSTSEPSNDDVSKNSMPRFVEAFDAERRSVEGVRSRMLTSELLGEGLDRGLGIAEELVDHYTTYDWYDPSFNAPYSIPLVHNNTLNMIADQGKVGRQVAHAGFVFGKVARGWDVWVSGRAEKPVYMYASSLKDINGNFVRDSSGNIAQIEGAVIDDGHLEKSIDQERYYAILNVPPGAHWVRVRSRWNEGEGAVPVAVFAGGGSHMDLTQIAKRTLNGWFFHGHLKGSIEVCEQSARIDLGDERAHDFSIPNVVTFGNYPFYIRYRNPNIPNVVFQYRIFPAQMDNKVAIFPIPRRKVEQWIPAIEDEEDPDDSRTGKDLVVVGAPRLVDKMREPLTPHLEYLSLNGGVRLKTYSLSPSVQPDSPYDEAVRDGMLLGSTTRFIGKTPKGLTIASLELDNAASGQPEMKKVWSELTMIWRNGIGGIDDTDTDSVHIINVIGPY